MFDKLQFISLISIRFHYLCIIFHISFLCFSLLIINTFEGWNITLKCFTFSFMFHFSKHCGSGFTLPQCFWIAPTVFLNCSHSVFVFLPQCFLNETLKLKMKHKYTMFHLLNTLIINVLKLKNETWKQKMPWVNTRKQNVYLGRSETFCRGFCRDFQTTTICQIEHLLIFSLLY